MFAGLLPLGSSVEYVLPLLLSGISHEFCRKVSWALQAYGYSDFKFPEVVTFYPENSFCFQGMDK